MCDTRTFTRRFLTTWLGGTALAALTLVAAAPGAAVAEDDKVITFGASISLTGRLAHERRLVRDGYDFIIEHLNQLGGIPVGDDRYQLRGVYYDDESDADTAARLVDRLLVEDEVDFLLGPYSSLTTFPASTVAERFEVPMVVAHAAATPIYERGYRYLFATLPIIDQFFNAVLDMAVALEPRPETVAIINEDSMAPTLVLDSAAARAEHHGVEILYRESYPTGSFDVSSMLAAIRELRPDMVLAGGYTSDMISLVKQAKDMGVEPALFGLMLGPSLPGFTDTLGADAEYLVEPVEWSPNMVFTDPVLGWSPMDYAQLFEERFGYWPDHHPPQSSAAVMVYYHAIEQAGTLDRQAVRDAIAETDIMTFYGPVRFDELGRNAAKGMAVIQVQDGRPVVIYPPDVATGEIIYPRPTR